MSDAPKRTLDELPSPPSWPFIGSAHLLGHEGLHRVLEDWGRAYGDAYTFRIGPKRVLAVAKPEIVREVMQRRPDTFRRLGAMETVAREVDLVGVFAAEGSDWRRQRRLMNPSFHASHLETFHDSIAEVTARLGDHWGARAGTESVDVLHDLMRFTVDVTSIVAFGRDLDTLRRGSESIQQHLEIVFPTLGRRMLSPVRYWRVMPFLDVGFGAALAAIRTLMLELVRDARLAVADERGRRERPRTLLEAMVLARDDEDAREPLTDLEVYANVVTLLLAGEDTTANTLAFALHYLALRPDVQDAVRREVDSVVGDAAVPTSAHVRALVYVEAVALETLRLRSPAPQLMLEALHDTEVDDIAVPRGTAVMLLTRLVSMNPAVFGDPTRFRPERWLDDAPADTKPHHPRLMLAFGGGPRVCPGRLLALRECVQVIAATVRRFEIVAACRPEDVREVTAFTMQPRGITLRFLARHAHT